MSALLDFTDGQLNAILAQANADYNVFKQVLDFNAASSDAVSTRTNILDNIKVRRDQVFDQLWQYVLQGALILAAAIVYALVRSQRRRGVMRGAT